ncbi:MAG TPA: NBR1-Ig-like domain-containing protein [Chloroflexota bacterium]|nr:NBR1-Ig-like domain-containing protein [Chloroflexota bacterium]
MRPSIRFPLAVLLISTLVAAAPGRVAPALACAQPATWDVGAAFRLAASGLLPSSYPELAVRGGPREVPASLLMAIGWVESGWRQLDAHDRPLLSFDFGYGIMQITSGMAGAFGDPAGTIDASTQSAIASDYRFNIAYGARVLAEKWLATPKIGTGDPGVIEDWYYAIWAYNGWGWVNNPNNPRFSREGTPATNPAAFPYQERVLYLVAHPPRDVDGNPLWKAIPITLPGRRQIARQPSSFNPRHVHREDPPASSAIYEPAPLPDALPGTLVPVRVRLINTGLAPWLAGGAGAATLTYHVFNADGDPWVPFSPFSPGVISYGQGPVALPHPVLPGHSVTLHARVRAPQQPGKYLIVWDLQQSSGLWLSQQGALPRAEPLPVGGVSFSTPTPVPTLRPEPLEDLAYVADTSIPDGSVLGKHQRFRKGWLVFNNGRADWGGGWRLVEVSGPFFGRRAIAVPATLACHSTNILADLRAPTHPGRYSGVWRMVDTSGHRFGQKLTLVITVSGAPPRPTPTPSAQPTATPTPPSGPTATPTPVG